MIFLIVLSVISVVAVAVGIGLYIDRNRYTAFVSVNSLRLRALKEINSEFEFFPEVNYDQSYTYDNESYYSTISCEDFLIYQLQFSGEEVRRQIEKLNRNKIEYLRYTDRIKALRAGDFSAPTGKLAKKRLLKIEEQVCKKAQLAMPPTRFFLGVTLCCARMNGMVYARKAEVFSAESVMILIKRLRNKNGTYYRDRAIWDAICRVERGKVSNKMRFEIFARDGYRCRQCGASGSAARLEIDHIVPISKGGKSTYDNLQTLCHNCNFEKSNKY